MGLTKEIKKRKQESKEGERSFVHLSRTLIQQNRGGSLGQQQQQQQLPRAAALTLPVEFVLLVSFSPSVFLFPLSFSLLFSLSAGSFSPFFSLFSFDNQEEIPSPFFPSFSSFSSATLTPASLFSLFRSGPLKTLFS